MAPLSHTFWVDALVSLVSPISSCLAHSIHCSPTHASYRLAFRTGRGNIGVLGHDVHARAFSFNPLPQVQNTASEAYCVCPSGYREGKAFCVSVVFAFALASPQEVCPRNCSIPS
ncbi:hypothetical protein FB451DRAFT_490229 [Mycena latifolia]|nr:hypothetical protein FB451DRAFT_490229 [Mycena latifolia]